MKNIAVLSRVASLSGFVVGIRYFRLVRILSCRRYAIPLGATPRKELLTVNGISNTLFFELDLR